MKSSRASTHSHSEPSDPNVSSPPPTGSWAMKVIPGVRPWEELVGELSNSRAI